MEEIRESNSDIGKCISICGKRSALQTCNAWCQLTMVSLEAEAQPNRRIDVAALEKAGGQSVILL